MISDCKSRDKRLLPDALSVSYDLQGENWHQEHCLNSLSKELLEGWRGWLRTSKGTLAYLFKMEAVSPENLSRRSVVMHGCPWFTEPPSRGKPVCLKEGRLNGTWWIDVGGLVSSSSSSCCWLQSPGQPHYLWPQKIEVMWILPVNISNSQS